MPICSSANSYVCFILSLWYEIKNFFFSLLIRFVLKNLFGDLPERSQRCLRFFNIRDVAFPEVKVQYCHEATLEKLFEFTQRTSGGENKKQITIPKLLNSPNLERFILIPGTKTRVATKHSFGAKWSTNQTLRQSLLNKLLPKHNHF